MEFECLDAAWGLEPHVELGAKRREVEKVKGFDDGHCLTGPVYVQGAKPGNTLAVRIDAVEVGDWGWTFAGGWDCPWNQRIGVLEDGVLHRWIFDEQAATATNQFGHTVTILPFMGVMGMPPAEPGCHSTVPPRRTGGNIDCKELTVGTTLYLPVEVEGGLFSVGDGHAAQGDGEICITAIECPMRRVVLNFQVIDEMSWSFPIARTAGSWIALGFDEDVDEAVAHALDGMLRIMMREHGLSRLDALALASIAVDFRVTQMVNNVRGAHAVLRDGAIR